MADSDFWVSLKGFFRSDAVQQSALLVLWGVVATVAATYLNVGGAITNGLGTAFGVVLMVTLIALPISYMMNSLMYHSRAMRAGTGIAAWMFGGLVWVYVVFRSAGALLGAQEKMPYFGLFPLFDPAAAAAEEEGGWLKAFTFLWREFKRYFQMDIGRDVARMETLLAPYVASSPAEAVPEAVYDGARRIATESATAMDAFKSLVGTARTAKEQELAEVRAEERKVLGEFLMKSVLGSGSA